MNSFNIVTLSCLDWSGFMSTVQYTCQPIRSTKRDNICLNSVKGISDQNRDKCMCT